MSTNVLLLGRTGIVLDDVKEHLDVKNINLFAGTTLDDVKALFEQENIGIVIMGAGLDIEIRLQIIKTIFSLSKATTVHLKDWASGPTGMYRFVNGILNGLIKN